MFTDRYFGKGRNAKKAEKQAASQASDEPKQAAEPSFAQPAMKPAAVLQQFTASDTSGLALDDYARLHSLSEAEVWDQVRRGALAARTQGGRVVVYQSEPSLPDLPEEADLPPRVGASAAASEPTPAYLSLSGDRGPSPELALLLDHLSLAKEENREILKLTQDSLRKVTELSDRIVEMKDAVIEAKDTQIAALREQLAERERTLQRLRQQNEDLEMLARAVAKSP